MKFLWQPAARKYIQSKARQYIQSKVQDSDWLAHCSAILLGCEIGDRHKYPMSNNRYHLVGQLTTNEPN